MTSFWNMVLPMLALCGIVVGLPMLLMPAGRVSQRRLTGVTLTTALVAWVTGAAILAVLDVALNPGQGASLLAAPIAGTVDLMGRATRFALLWGPLLGFVWLVRAQEMNRRIGLLMRDGTGEDPSALRSAKVKGEI